ncbi:Smr/MutS family protein [Hyphococcus flavus]|uniref:Smr/MutS family protein n=1 Tax=Hyphococcus flavus TaxID=1866326 RepID=A0AAF0CGS2_9PROT|nr:Smr/MutS family protein [Hyphococcus flavus]WDI32804.1 Smr/MutS family protein [Hyphococcus flavus]
MSGRRKLTPEEDALWRKATRDIARYAPQKPDIERVISGADQRPSTPEKARLPKSPGNKQTGAAKAGARPRPDPFSAGDPRLDRLASRGRIEIEAVLDLHGHKQETARRTLHQFIQTGYARGARCLLVITGKGAGDGASAGRGVLRARFPDWMAEEPVRGLVSRAARAHQRHGGDGAFYVFLKR